MRWLAMKASSTWGDEMGEICGFDHQIQDRVEQERVMERDERQVEVAVADEVIRPVTGRKVKCDCGSASLREL